MISRKAYLRVVFVVAIVFLSLCGTVYADGWTNYTSEENPPLQCPNGQLVAGMRCTGNNCDNISLYCRSIGNRSGASVKWGPYLSEEAPNNICPNGMYAKGVACRGSRCDNQSLLYYRVNNANHNKCQWTRWFSEESCPPIAPDIPYCLIPGAGSVPLSSVKYNSAVCPGGTYVVGITCKGGYCDNKQLLCCGF